MSLRIKAALIILSTFLTVNTVNFVLNLYLTNESINEAVEQDLSLTVGIIDNLKFSLKHDLLISSLFFLLFEVIVAICLFELITRPFYKLKEQAAEIQNEHKRVKILLNAMPLVCHLWNEKLDIFECNDENYNLFKINNKDELIKNFPGFSPKYQCDGQLSAVKKDFYLKKAFEEGRCVFEWMHQLADGTPLPVEITLVRVVYENKNIIAAYLRDLREQKQMMTEIEQRDIRLNTINQTAAILLKSEPEDFERDLKLCMAVMAESMNLDRVYIWKNFTRDGRLYCSQIYEFSENAEPQQDSKLTMEISYDEKIPGWEEKLSSGQYINSLVRNMSPEEQAQLVPQGIVTIFIIPVFLHNEFWGFIGYDDCSRERIFSENEISILHSGGIIIANALLRNEMVKNIQASAAKLKAVIDNFPGIIWTADLNHEITLFDGQLPEKLGQDPLRVTGRKLEEYFEENCNGEQYEKIIQNIEKTITDGPQDWVADFGGLLLHNHSSLLYDDSSRIIGLFGSVVDITELSRLQDELKDALEKAREASSAKSDFLAKMSHEMRTPLNAIIGLSGLALDSEELNEDAQSNLEKIYNAGESLLCTVNDILDISKIEAGKLELVPSVYDIPSLINDAVTQSIMRIGEKPIRFDLDISDDLPTQLYGDELRLKQIFNNLLSNAFKYTKVGTVKLSVHCERDRDDVWMTVRVEDTGIGIRKEDMDKLFTNYTKVDAKFNHQIEGTGLGLSIIKNLTKIMGGSVEVESEYGRGSIFTVKLRQTYVDDTTIGKELVNNLKNFNYSDKKRKRSSSLVRMKIPNARVLVVDDVATNLDVARGMMRPYGMKIDCVSSGQAAIDAIREERTRYDAVFMDHMMPGIDGMEAARIIREEIGTEYAKSIPIIALTANAIVGNRELFLKNGFQDFISKPIDVVQLDSILRTWIKSREDGETISASRTETASQAVKLTESPRNQMNILEGEYVPGVDFREGIKRFGAETDYLDVIHSYCKYTSLLLDRMRRLSAEVPAASAESPELVLSLDEYAIIVHGIKGSSYGICANMAGAEAEKLEKAAKAGDIEQVMAKNPSFIKIMESLLVDLDVILQKAANRKEAKKSAPAPDSALLSRLFAAAGDYNTPEMEQIMEELETYEYESGDELVCWLREQMDFFEYDAIRKRLENVN